MHVLIHYVYLKHLVSNMQIKCCILTLYVIMSFYLQ